MIVKKELADVGSFFVSCLFVSIYLTISGIEVVVPRFSCTSLMCN